MSGNYIVGILYSGVTADRKSHVKYQYLASQVLFRSFGDRLTTLKAASYHTRFW